MVRTRFAPSPTGFVHIGSLRTALYNFLFARGNGGKFILRIEDTDRTRLVEGSMENLIKIMKWAGLTFDEGPDIGGKYGPYIQSERTEIYREHEQILVNGGNAYPCFCTTERLEEMRKRQTELKMAPMYDRTCLKLSKDEVEAKMKAGIPHVIRQKIPHGRKLKFKDLVRGHVSFDTETIDDQVLMKSDNFPTYHLANVVDDHMMEITHVIRGEEWLPSTPKHLLLYEAFGWTAPEFAHIPLLLNKDKSKLSKRQGDVSVEDFIKKGIIPETLINFVALLGWHPGKGDETEIFTLTDLIEKFSLEKVHKSGAIFDPDKLSWFNFQWQKKMHFQNLEKIAKEIDAKVEISLNSKNESCFRFKNQKDLDGFIEKRAGLLKNLCGKYLPAEWLKQNNLLDKALITIEEKILKSPAEAPQYLKFYFEPSEYPLELLLNAKMNVDTEMAEKALADSCGWLVDFNSLNSIEEIQSGLLAFIAQKGLKNGQILWPLRVALTGEQFSPGVFEVIWVLGKEESLKRLKKGLAVHFRKSV
jgi:glutamyl-tRNA synthetase